jgi:hypothetical protein
MTKNDDSCTNPRSFWTDAAPAPSSILRPLQPAPRHATIITMDDFRSLAQDPRHRRNFEKLLFLAAKRGDADLVAERLSWGIDPNCASSSGVTPLIANIRSFCPNVATVQALLKHGADPVIMDHNGLTAVDYARRKLARMHLHNVPRPRKSPSLDENDQLSLGAEEQAELDRFRRENPDLDREFFRVYLQERKRAAQKQINDPEQVEQVVAILETAAGNPK